MLKFNSLAIILCGFLIMNPVFGEVLCTEFEWDLIASDAENLNSLSEQYSAKYPERYTFGTVRCYESYFKQFARGRERLPSMKTDFKNIEDAHQSVIEAWGALATACEADDNHSSAEGARQNEENLRAWSKKNLYGPKGPLANINDLEKSLSGLDSFIAECKAMEDE